ncbi:uncharacterized protein LOC109853923 [Pseudomyrmex gracilis]|uniref:uncharacterized protein LOC109853923 n=1 Tax=Pseudomyrmex gracilis TaxID=219809 RepID=UPI0009959016|nr:uncharacterized protein LOC109853923 [Pseudomyrmex gracilis]
MVSTNTLMKIASIGGLVTGCTGYAFHFRVQHNIRESETFKNAISALRAHKKAVPYLGEPLQLGRIRYGNEHHPDQEPSYTWFKVSLTGSNTKGSLYYEVTLDRENKTPEVSKIEVTFDNIPGKTFVLRDNVS